jgi:nucleoside 2-deoxyribosyltransferase
MMAVPDQREKRKVYLAGPDVFLSDALVIARRKKELCSAYGFEGLHPFDNEPPDGSADEGRDRVIYRANESMIRQADFGICNLTPFRGPSADVGTVFELGMLVGLGKRVFGYTNVVSDLIDRCQAVPAFASGTEKRIWLDANGMEVEDFGNADNLMIDNALVEHGGHRMVRHAADPAHLFDDLSGFEICLKIAAEAYARAA